MEIQGEKERQEHPDDKARQAVVQAEVDRMKALPAHSAYAVHRLKVLGKMIQLLQVPHKDRTSAEVDDLERLFAELAF